MAEMNNYEDIQENFAYITEAIDSMRAQNAMNAGNFDKVLTNITNQLESLSVEENTDLIKVFLAELKRSLDERHNFVSSKFSEIETQFQDLVTRSEAQLKGHEIKELFEIIAGNLNTVSNDFTSQRDLITEIGLKIDEFAGDDSAKKEILKNISTLKSELEKYGNGFESIILNLNSNFEKVSESISDLDTSEALDNIKKDIENIFVSSNAVLSTLQVIDRKNMEFGDIISNLVTKDAFSLEQEHVAKLIAQNIQITDYMNTLPSSKDLQSLTEKVDTTVGVLNAIKNMLSETGLQTQQILTAQLDNLEKKILNISTEEEFIGFRKELSEFAQQVIQSTNLMRGDLAETNEELKGLLSYLSAMDIKNSFETFASLTKVSENNIQESISKLSDDISKEIGKNKNLTKTDIDSGVGKVNETVNQAKEEIVEDSKSNLATVLEHIQSVVNNIFSVKNAIHIENMESAEAIDNKFQDLKEDLTNSSNFIVQNSQENLESILSNVENVLQELFTVKEGLNEASSLQTSKIDSSLVNISEKVEEIKRELNQTSQENFESIFSVVEDFSEKLSSVKMSLDQSSEEKAAEAREIIGGLSLKLSSFQDNLSRSSEINFSEVKASIEDLTQITQDAKSSIEQHSSAKFSGIKSDIDNLNHELKIAQENFEALNQANLLKIVTLFHDLTEEFNANKASLSEATQANYEAMSLYIQNLNQKLDEAKSDFNQDLKAHFEDVQFNLNDVKSTMEALPREIKENQEVFENEHRVLIEENSRNIQDVGDNIQNLIKGLVARENPFKGEVMYEFGQVKVALEAVKEDLSQSNQEFARDLENQINSLIQNIEASISNYDEKHDLALLSLQNKIVEYFEIIKDVNEQSDLKLDNSIKEISSIKPEINAIIQSLSVIKADTSIADLSVDVSDKFDGVLANITQLEEIFSEKNRDSLQSVLGSLDIKFDSISSSLKSYQNLATQENADFVEELSDKVETLKAQINLVNTDVSNTLTEKTAEMVTMLSSISDEISKVSEVNFEEIAHDIKSQLESSYFSVKSAISAELKQGSELQQQKIAEDFENLNNNLNELVMKLSSERSEGIVELKTVLDEVIQRVEKVSSTTKENATDNKFLIEQITGIESLISDIKYKSVEPINGTLQTVLEKIEELNLSSDSTENFVSSAKASILEKVDIVQDRLIDAQDEAQVELAGKISEAHLQTRTEIVDKVIEAQEETKAEILGQIKENIDSVKDSYEISAQSLASKISDSSKEQVFEKIDAVQDKLQESQTANKTVILNQIIQSNNEAKLEILSDLEEKVAAIKENYYLSTQSLISRTMEAANEQAFEKIETAQEQILEAQNDTKSNILLKIIETQESSKVAILDELKDHITFIKENISSFNLDEHFIEEFSQKIKNLQTTFQLVSEEIDQISVTQENYHLSTQSLVSKTMDASNEKVFERLDLVQEKLLDTQVEIKTELAEKIHETTEEVKAEILTELRETLDSAKDNQNISTQSFISKTIDASDDKTAQWIDVAQERILDAQEQAKEELIDKIFDAREEVKAEIIDRVREGQDESRSQIIDKLLEVQDDTKAEILSELNENFTSIQDKLSESQDNSSAEMLDKILQTQEVARIEFLNELQENIASVKENYNLSTQTIVSKTMEASNDKVFEKISAMQDKLYDIQNEIKTLILDQIVETSDIAKEEIVEKLLKGQDEAREDIIEKISELRSQVKEDILEEMVKAQSSVKEDILEKISESEKDTKESILETLAKSHDEAKEAILDKIIENHEETQKTIIDELKENLKLFKQDLDSGEVEEDITAVITERIESLQENLLEASKSVEDKVLNLEGNYMDSAKALLSEIKTSFNDKVDDSLDELKSFIEILENKKDIALNIDDLKYELFDKFSELADSVDTSIASVSVKDDLDELSKGIESSIDDMFEKLQEKIVSTVENNPAINDVCEKSDEINRRMEELKNVIIGDISHNLSSFELNIDNQRKEISEANEELKALVADLKESYVDLSVNSSMELSNLLVNIQEKVENLDVSKKLNTIEARFDELDFGDKIETIDNKLSKLDFSQKLETLESKLDGLDFNEKFDNLGSKIDDFDFTKIIESSKNQINKEFETINQKLDLFAVESESGSDEEVQEGLKEIKQLVQSQTKLIEQINKSVDAFDAVDDSGDSKEGGSVQEEIQKSLKGFEAKLNELSIPQSSGENGLDDVKDELSEFKKDLFENLVNLFTQISFVVEAEEIKDFVEEKTEEIKAEISSKLKNIKVSGDGANFELETEDIKDFIKEGTDDVKEDIREFIKEETEEIKSRLKRLQSGLEEESADSYSYTLQDVESDIAKVRMVLNDIIKSTQENIPEQHDGYQDDFDALNENILSISTRTNKLLLNSDESYNALKENLSEFRSIVYQTEERLRNIDNSEVVSRMDKKLDTVSNLVASSVKSDKIFNQSFMYLAEWVDTASNDIGNILEKVAEIDGMKLAVADLKKAMPKRTDIESIMDEISDRFDKQQARIDSLERSIEKLLEQSIQIDTKPDTKLAKKIDSIDKQLLKLGKGIEKLTSYVDEE